MRAFVGGGGSGLERGMGRGRRIVRRVQSVQLSSNDFYKRVLAGDGGELTVGKRLLAGAAAGMTATAVGHPLDTLRLRLALPNSGYTGMTDALFKVVRGEGAIALAKGLPAALAGIAPYAAINFAAYDMTKKVVYDKFQVRSRSLSLRHCWKAERPESRRSPLAYI